MAEIQWTVGPVRFDFRVVAPLFAFNLNPPQGPAVQLSALHGAAVQLSALGVAPRRGSRLVTELASIHIPEGTDVRLMFRLVGDDGTYPDEADIAAITADVYDLTSSTPTTSLGTEADFSASYQTNGTPTTDGGWVTDTTGFNCEHTFAGETYFPEGGRRYLIEVHIDASTVADWGKTQIQALVHTLPALSE